MHLQHYPVQQLKTELLSCVKAEAGEQKFRLFFFGSRVKGNADERADIDVGFLGESELDISAKARINERIDKIETLYKRDFIDFGNVDAGFRDLARQKNELIYE